MFRQTVSNPIRGGPRVAFSVWFVVKLVHITGYCIGAMKQCCLIISRRSRVTSSMSPRPGEAVKLYVGLQLPGPGCDGTNWAKYP